LLALLDMPRDEPPWKALDEAQRPRRTLDRVKRRLSREAREQPLLLIIEDLHRIDGGAQGVLDGLVRSQSAVRLMLVVN
jgi:predicted ATPase